MTDKEIIEVMARGIEPDWMAASTNGAFADVNEDVSNWQHATRQKAGDILAALRSSGWDVVRKDARLAQADALAEAAARIADIINRHMVFHRSEHGFEEPGDSFTHEIAHDYMDLRAALSAYRSGKGGWRHRKTGGVYRIIGKATREHDLVEQVVYQSVKDGRVWSRPESEFYDGRFEKLPSPPTSKSEAGDE